MVLVSARYDNAKIDIYNEIYPGPLPAAIGQLSTGEKWLLGFLLESVNISSLTK